MARSRATSPWTRAQRSASASRSSTWGGMVLPLLIRARSVALPSSVTDEPSDPPVVGVVAALHHALLDQPVDQSRHGGDRHVQGLGEVVPGGPVALGGDQRQHLELLHGQRGREQRLGPGGQGPPVEGGVQLLEPAQQGRSIDVLADRHLFHRAVGSGLTLGCPDYTADANDSLYPTYRDAVTSLTRLSLANRLIVALISIAIVVFGVLATRSLKQELLPSTQVPDRGGDRDLPRRDPADRGRQRLHPDRARGHRRLRASPT